MGEGVVCAAESYDAILGYTDNLSFKSAILVCKSMQPSAAVEMFVVKADY